MEILTLGIDLGKSILAAHIVRSTSYIRAKAVRGRPFSGRILSVAKAGLVLPVMMTRDAGGDEVRRFAMSEAGVDVGSLWEALGEIPDRRGTKGRQYGLRSVLVPALAAMLSGANDLRAIFRCPLSEPRRSFAFSRLSGKMAGPHQRHVSLFRGAGLCHFGAGRCRFRLRVPGDL